MMNGVLIFFEIEGNDDGIFIKFRRN